MSDAKTSMKATAFRLAPLCSGIVGKMRAPTLVAQMIKDRNQPIGPFCTIQSCTLSPTRWIQSVTSTRLTTPSTLILVNLPLVTEDGAFPRRMSSCPRLTCLILGCALGGSSQRIPCSLPRHLYLRRSTSAMPSHSRVAGSRTLMV